MLELNSTVSVLSDCSMKRKESQAVSRTSLKNGLQMLGSNVRIRQRYLYTRSGRLRLRCIAPPLAVALMGLSALAGWTQSSRTPETADYAFLPAAEAVAPYEDRASSLYAFYRKRMQRYEEPGQTVVAAMQPLAQQPVAQVQPALPEHPSDKIIEIGKGDTLTGLLQDAGVAAEEAYAMVEALEGSFNPRNLRPGQKLSVHFTPAEEAGTYNPSRIDMPIDNLKTVALEKTKDGYKTSVVEKPVETKIYAHRAKIETSLYGSAAKAGIPSSVIADMIKIYSYDIDFQRDLRKGDIVEAMYEQVETKDGDPVRTGDLLFARLIIDGRNVPIYRYEANGIADYYTADGKSIRKSLMRTPVDGARISSGFGLRMHPVLGYTKMHKGMDFAAPTGTPIYAAGNGVVEKCGPFSSYGNYVRIRHNASMKTAYAHMSRFAPGIRSGQKVRQGQVIGYVGRTGRVTGAHLHYEVLVNNVQVNPSKMTMAQADGLTGKRLASFKAFVGKINQQYGTLSGSMKYAERDDGSDKPQVTLR